MAKKSKPLTSKRAKSASKGAQVLPEVAQSLKEPVPDVKAPEVPEVQSQVAAHLGEHMMFGLIDAELYAEIYAPAFTSYAERRDDTALRQLLESIVADIAMRDAYSQYRKIDDICQRYLYYMESAQTALDAERTKPAAGKDEGRDVLELEALTLYWREQVFYCLINDAEAIYGLLLPEQSMLLLPHVYLPAVALLNAARRLLCCTVGGVAKRTLTGDAADLYAFLTGKSFPYLGYEASGLFGYVGAGNADGVRAKKLGTHALDDELEQVFALLMPDHAERFATCLRKSIEEILFLDLIAAQHPKLYAELSEAFGPDESLPTEVRERLMQRVRFDKVYREAFGKLLTAQPLTKALHRSSHLDIAELNLLGRLHARLKFAVKHHLAVFVFHLND